MSFRFLSFKFLSLFFHILTDKINDIYNCLIFLFCLFDLLRFVRGRQRRFIIKYCWLFRQAYDDTNVPFNDWWDEWMTRETRGCVFRENSFNDASLLDKQSCAKRVNCVCIRVAAASTRWLIFIWWRKIIRLFASPVIIARP